MHPPHALTAPAAARNRDPILAILKRILPATGLVLEIAAGTGEHALFFSSALPHLAWQPTDPDAAARASIEAWRDHAGPRNFLPPLPLDAAAPATWPVPSADAILCVNMVHISPWAATEGLFEGAARLLPGAGPLILYGPYFDPGAKAAPSNLAFDQDLKSRNPAWGLRGLDDMNLLARRNGFTLAERIDMPANNLTLVFRKDAAF